MPKGGFMFRKRLTYSALVLAFILALLQFTPPDFIYRHFVAKSHATDITNLQGNTSKIADEDVYWGTGQTTDTFSSPTYTGGNVTLTKVPALAANLWSIIKGEWYVSSATTIADHGNAATVGSLAYVAAAIGSDVRRLAVPPGTYTISTNLTLAANIVLAPSPGALLSPSTGKTLTIGKFEAGPWQCFSGAGSVVLPACVVRIPQWWGAVADGITDSTTAFKAWATSVTDNSVAVIPPGSYLVNTTFGPIGFHASNIKIKAEGALITEVGTNAVTFDLNKNALPDETVITNNVYWEGGTLQSQTAAVGGGNTNVGIRVRGITRGYIRGTYGREFGTAFIQNSCRDAFHILECHGYNNGRHVHIPEYITTATGNPQGFTISNCGFSIHYVAGIAIDSSADEIAITNNYFVGKDAIVIESGSAVAYGNFNNQNIRIIGNGFEGGTTGNYYIRSPATNATRTLYSLVIEQNAFQLSATKCIQLVKVASAFIDKNRFVSTEDGFIDIGADCTKIKFGQNDFFGSGTFTAGLAFACDRKEITFSESVRFRDVIQLVGWNYTAISTGTGTLDMSALTGTYWTGEPDTKFCPPKAWLLRVRVEDSGTGANLGIRFAKNSSENATYGARAWLDSVTAAEERTYEFWVNADDAGDIYWDATASGAGTLKVQIMVAGWAR